MDAIKCRAFLVAAQRGSFTAAAQELGYTQSGITRMINVLEEELAASEGAAAFAAHCRKLLAAQNVTLAYAAKNEQENHVLVLREWLRRNM